MKNLLVENLSVSYEQKLIFKSISFEVKRGEILALFGSNGCGKSTLLKSITNLVSLSSGQIILPRNNSNNMFSIIPQDFRETFFNWTSVFNNILLTLPYPIKKKPIYKKIIKNLMNDFGITLNLNLSPSSCSGGMLQQASILRAFMTKPNILLADEPFSALDVNVSKQIKSSFVRNVKENNIIAIVVLHNIEDIIEIADKVLVIPNMPFSMKKEDNLYHAKLILNENSYKHNISKNPTSFIKIAEELLSKKADK